MGNSIANRTYWPEEKPEKKKGGGLFRWPERVVPVNHL